MILKSIKSIFFCLRNIIFKLGFFYLSPKVDPPLPVNIRNILLIRMDRIGDLVLSVPVIKAIRLLYPHARITLAGTRLSQQILGYSDICDVILIEPTVAELKLKKFDMVFDLIQDRSLKSALLAFQSGVPYRVGFDIAGRGVFFNIKVKTSPEACSFIDESMCLVRQVGFDQKTPDLVLSVHTGAQIAIKKFLDAQQVSAENILVCVHPGGHYPTQRWLPERFAQVINRLMERPQVKVVLLGAEHEKHLMDEIKERLSHSVILFVDRPLDQWAALLKQSQLLLCNNSGMLHMACAVGTVTVSMMGPTEVPRWLPHGDQHIVIRKNIPCIGCNQGICQIGSFDCMQHITVDEVYEACVSQIQT